MTRCALSDLPAPLQQRLRPTPAGCWEWTGPVSRSNGRPKTSLVLDGVRYTLPYRAALAATQGAPLPGMVTAHACGNKLCCRPDRRHARWATSADNGHDERRRGTRAGERSPRARLTAAAVARLRAGGALDTATVAALATQYGVTPHAIRDAARGRTWQHLPPAEERTP